MQIVGKFKNGTITISNLRSEDCKDYVCHLCFDLKVETYNTSFIYNFGEVVYFQLYDFIDKKQQRLVDENAIDNYLELTKEFFGVNIEQNGFSSRVKLEFEGLEDQESLDNFLLELRAYSEVLMKG